MKVKFAIAGYFLVIVALFFYSFTQVDLSLTLSRSGTFQTVEKLFQHVGYFERPLSAQYYIAIILSLFAFYFLFLKLVENNLISRKQLWFIIAGTAVILNFSYNAFSYDLFNYIFDAKIFTFYHQNPYLHKALDFSAEPMLSFMHWTQRTYPYGPTWLGITIPLSYLGFNFFLPTFFLFKTLMSVSFLLTAYFIGKILKKFSPKKELVGLVFFALNPLVIVESLVSSHNDIFMLMLGTASLYLFLSHKYIRGFLLLFLSFGVKFATGFIFPVFAGVLVWKRLGKTLDWDKIILLIIVFMTTAVVAASLRTNFQPWYLLYVLPFAALISNKYFISIPSVIFSVSSLLIYIPFLASGNWDPPIPMQLFWITLGAGVISLVFVLAFRFKNLLE